MGEDTDEDRDPVDALAESVDDRDGDPFASLPMADRSAHPDDGDAEHPDDGDGEPEPAAAPGGPPGSRSQSDSQGAAPTDSTREDEEAPDSASPAHPGAQSARDRDPFDAVSSAFEEMDVEDIDSDQVWQSLEEAEARGSVTDTQERTHADVSKHSYCERCEYFSGPPAIQCTHQGTEILEFPDLETVRVVDCPVVAARRSLQRER